MTAKELEKRFRDAAKKHATDELEIDDNAKVTMGTEPGAFVEAWIWIPYEEAIS